MTLTMATVPKLYIASSRVSHISQWIQTQVRISIDLLCSGYLSFALFQWCIGTDSFNEFFNLLHLLFWMIYSNTVIQACSAGILIVNFKIWGGILLGKKLLLSLLSLGMKVSKLNFFFRGVFFWNNNLSTLRRQQMPALSACLTGCGSHLLDKPNWKLSMNYRRAADSSTWSSGIICK